MRYDNCFLLYENLPCVTTLTLRVKLCPFSQNASGSDCRNKSETWHVLVFLQAKRLLSLLARIDSILILIISDCYVIYCELNDKGKIVQLHFLHRFLSNKTTNVIISKLQLNFAKLCNRNLLFIIGSHLNSLANFFMGFSY